MMQHQPIVKRINGTHEWAHRPYQLLSPPYHCCLYKHRRQDERQPLQADRCPFVPRHSLSQVTSFMQLGMLWPQRYLPKAVNAIQEWATRNGFRFTVHKCIVIYFTVPHSKVQKQPTVRNGNTLLLVEEPTKFLGLPRDSHLLQEAHKCTETHYKEALNPIWVVPHLKWGGTVTPF